MYSLNTEDSSAYLIPRWNSLWNEALKSFSKIFFKILIIFLGYFERKKILEKKNEAKTRSKRNSAFIKDTTPLLTNNSTINVRLKKLLKLKERFILLLYTFF